MAAVREGVHRINEVGLKGTRVTVIFFNLDNILKDRRFQHHIEDAILERLFYFYLFFYLFLCYILLYLSG